MNALRAQRQWAAPLALFLLALLFRSLPFGRVFTDERTVFTGNDAWYHMHRVRDSLAPGNWPSLIDFDPLLNWPHGARAIWTPFFDLIVSTFTLPFHAVGGLAAAEIAAAWLPPLLGALCVVVLYFAARELTDETTARIAGALLAVLVSHTWYSQVGFVDHHVAVTLLAALMLLLAMQFARAPDLSGSALLSAAQATAILLWPGALLHVVFIEVGTNLALAQRSQRATALAYKHRSLGHVFALVLVGPFCLGQQWAAWSDYSATVLSLFQPLLFVGFGLHAAACSQLLRSEFAESPARRTGVVVGTALGLGLAAVGLIPGLRESGVEALAWFGRSEAFQANVAESEPLLYRGGTFTLEAAALRLSWLFVALPLLWAAFMWTAWGESRRSHSEERAGVLVFGSWAFGILLAAFFQKRFAHSASLAAALLYAWGLRSLLTRMARHGAPRAAGVAAAAVLLLALAPALRLHAETLRASLRGEFTTSNHSKQRLLDAADWLRTHAGEPATGVLAPWHLGHPLLYVSGLPMVVGNFGDDIGAANFERHLEYFRATETRGARILDSVRTRFVVVESIPLKTRNEMGPRMMHRRLTVPELRDLERHRLRYASLPDGRPSGTASYRIFELVDGAIVEGRAAPGATVAARMRVGRNQIALANASVTTTAGADGRYALRLAQAGSDALSGKWQIVSDRRSMPLDVPEAAVLAGERLHGPDFSGNQN
ncbi:MAG: STT3 domain-containing protein [Myxococcota bacterium]|nr:STT3 domain-containing protein [Myxococcota bacterium]